MKMFTKVSVLVVILVMVFMVFASADSYQEKAMQRNIREELASLNGNPVPAYFTAYRNATMQRNIREELESLSIH